MQLDVLTSISAISLMNLLPLTNAFKWRCFPVAHRGFELPSHIRAPKISACSLSMVSRWFRLTVSRPRLSIPRISTGEAFEELGMKPHPALVPLNEERSPYSSGEPSGETCENRLQPLKRADPRNSWLSARVEADDIVETLLGNRLSLSLYVSDERVSRGGWSSETDETGA